MASWIGTGASNPGDVCTLGKVGIGTSGISQPLHIYGSSYPMAIIESSSGDGGDLFLKSNAGSWEMYIQGEDLRFYSNADRVTIKKDGKVGIGTTEPAHELDIVGDGTTMSPVVWVEAYGDNRGISSTINGGNGVAVLGATDNDSTGAGVKGVAYNASGTGGVFENVSDDAIALRTGLGKVGIGTTSPAQKLDVKGNAVISGSQWQAGDSAYLYLGVGPSHYIKAKYGTGVQIGSYQAEDAITLKETTGNVGIGTTSPDAKLHIDSPAGTGKPALIIDQKDTDDFFVEFKSGTVYTGKTAQDEYLKIKDPNGNTRYIKLYS